MRITGSSSPISHMGSPAQMAKERPSEGQSRGSSRCSSHARLVLCLFPRDALGCSTGRAMVTKLSEQCPCRCASLSTAPSPSHGPPRIRTFLCLSSYMHSSAVPLGIWICRAGSWLWGQIWGEAFPTPRKEAITSGHCGLTVFAMPWSGPCLPAVMPWH